MFRRVALFAALALVCVSFHASAEDEKKALIHELMDVMGTEDLLRESIGATLDLWTGDYDMEGLPIEEQLKIEDARRREQEHRAKVLQRVDIQKYAAQAYYPAFERYSVAELKTAIAFYKTPAGQKSIALIPELASAGNKTLRQMSNDYEAVEREIEREEQSLAPKWKRTMADIRSMATASEAYATDMNEYPAAISLDELEAKVAPTYIRKLPREDGWGHEFTYVVTPDLQHYRFVSGGADGRIDGDSSVVEIFEEALKAQTRETTDPDDDIVYQDGRFVRYPREAAIHQ